MERLLVVPGTQALERELDGEGLLAGRAGGAEAAAGQAHTGHLEILDHLGVGLDELGGRPVHQPPHPLPVLCLPALQVGGGDLAGGVERPVPQPQEDSPGGDHDDRAEDNANDKEQLAHQAECSPLVAAALNQHVEDLAFVIDGAPEVHPLAGNPDHHLVEVPSIARAWATPPQLSCNPGAEFQNPAPHRFVGDIEPSLGQ